jgi:hypothetical protein
MRIIDCIPWESSVFFTLEKNDFIHPRFRHKPIGITSPLLLPCLNSKEYMGAIDGITTRVVVFILGLYSDNSSLLVRIDFLDKPKKR